MTTIAYRQGILAVDRQVNIGDTMMESDDKLHLINNGQVAIAVGRRMET